MASCSAAGKLGKVRASRGKVHVSEGEMTFGTSPSNQLFECALSGFTVAALSCCLFIGLPILSLSAAHHQSH